MASFAKFQQFVEDIAHKVHDLETDQLKLALTNTAVNATDATVSDITEIAFEALTYLKQQGLNVTSLERSPEDAFTLHSGKTFHYQEIYYHGNLGDLNVYFQVTDFEEDHHAKLMLNAWRTLK